MSVAVKKLKVADEDFLVSTVVERCPKVMMLRELVKNALEAAERAVPGNRRVAIRDVRVEGVRKLALWNTGPGMDADELYRMCDIASSIGKVKGLDRNFGMGAKVASLPSNQHGMRYRSCKAARVHEIMLGKRNDVYGRLLRNHPDMNQQADVLEVTQQAVAEGHTLDHDWTEVVLLGNRPDQDTVRDPYDGDPQMSNRWIVDELYYKFFRLPEGVNLTVSLGEGMHPAGGPRPMQALAARLPTAFARYEAVRLPDGVVLHYAYDPTHPTWAGCNQSDDGMLPSYAHAALVFQDEIYDLVQHWRWQLESPRFGVPFATRHISVQIELPPDHPVRPDGYRQFVRYLHGGQGQVKCEDFASLVLTHRPDWLIRLMDELSPERAFAQDVRVQLSRMLKELGVTGLRPRRPAPKPATAAPPREGVPGPAAAVAPAPWEGPLETEMETGEAAPEIFLLTDPKEIEDRLLGHRAARYYADQHILFVNLLYPAVEQMARVLQAEFGRAGHAFAGPAARQIAEHTMVMRIGRALVFGLSKTAEPEGWREWDLKTAICPEVMTIAADDFYGSLAEARERMRGALAGLEAAA